MQLTTDSKTTQRPTRSDVAHALADPAVDGEEIALDREDGDSLEATGRADGRYDLAYVEGRRIQDADPVTPQEARAVFLRYLENDARWKAGREWRLWTNSKPRPPLPVVWLIIAGVVASIGLTTWQLLR